MNESANTRRMCRLLGELCNGTIRDAELAWLDEQVRTDAAAQELYVDFMTMHGCLYSENASLKLHDSAPAKLPLVRRAFAGGFRSRGFLAASLLLVGTLGVALALNWGTRGDRLANLGSNSAGRAYVARITGTQNCRWDSSTRDLGYGSMLAVGQQLSLREGLAEITFHDGATLVLESPATVVVNDVHGVDLREGRLAAIVPPESNRFLVQTDTLELSNVGNEFGLLARRSGSSEVHVFNGVVNASFMGADGKFHRRMDLHAAEAALASSLTTTVVGFPANESYFVRSMLPSVGPQDGLLAYEGFKYPEGPLSAQNGGFGWAGPWFNIAADAQAGADSNRVAAGSLATQGVVPRGNRAAITAQQNRVRRSLATAVGGVFDVAGLVEDQDGVRLVGRDGMAVYLSFVQRVSAVDDGFYGLELHRGDGNSNRVLSIGNGADGTGYGATSTYNVYGAGNFPSLGDENIGVNFFVVKLVFGGGNRDLVEIYRNPASLDDEQACTPVVQLRGNFAFDRISLANFDGSKTHEVDELRVGTHFLAVTGRWGGERARLMQHFTRLRPRTPPFGAHCAGCDMPQVISLLGSL